MTLDLNADVGELAGATGRDLDGHLIPLLSSVSIACGGHAGDLSTMRATAHLALEHHVAIGAHPGYPDRAGFGRRETGATAAAVADLVREQVVALTGIVAAEGGTVRHVKLHGALYHRANADAEVAAAVAAVIATLDPALIVVGTADSALMRAARARGLRFAREAFADRAYLRDGQLVPRDRPGSVLTTAEAVLRVVRLARDGTVESLDGAVVPIGFDTVCVHSDTPDAPGLARAVRQALEDAGIRVAPMGGARPT